MRIGVNNNSIAAKSSLEIPSSISFNLNAASTEQKLI